VFDIWYCEKYPLDEIQVSDRVYHPGSEVWRPALADNIREQGLVNPLIVLNHRDRTKYKERWLKIGNNRYWALRELNWEYAPVIITGTCPIEPKQKLTFEEAKQYFKDGELWYDTETGYETLRLRKVSDPAKYEYPLNV